MVRHRLAAWHTVERTQRVIVADGPPRARSR
jgi:hypothetical protein